MQELTYRNYKEDKVVATDTETYDPYLREKGTGVFRKDGYICGVSFSNGDISEYYDINHYDTTPEDKEKNLKYIRDQLSSNNTKVFANGIYDLDWLVNFQGIEVHGKFKDVQLAEPLIDEYKVTYSLDSLAQKYLGEKKSKDILREFCDQNGLKLLKNDDPRKYIYKMPKDLIQQYGSDDTRLTYHIDTAQMIKLEEQDLLGIYELEIGLLPLLLQMRKQGVRLDRERLYKTGLELSDLSYELQNELNDMAGFELNPRSTLDMQKLFTKYNLPLVYNEPTELMLLQGKSRGNPSFSKATLEKINHPISKKILEIRHIKTLLEFFIVPYPELMVGDRLHCSFNLLRSDNFGTVSGRFSSSNPNLQQVSGKSEEDMIQHTSEILNGQVIRKLFVPEEGCSWLKLDWSQIEYRLMAHYAIGEGANTIRERYCEDPNTDYHEELGKLTGIKDRKIVKTLNFGAAYGMGVNKMSKVYGWNLNEARSVYELYHSRVPFVKETSNRVSGKARRVGYIKTILGRRAHLKNKSKSYVMYNRLIQGSAADLMKKAMKDAYEVGIFNVLHPHITVHDELDCSVPRTKEGIEASIELKHIMETCISLKVPIIADMEIGETWGTLKEIKEQLTLDNIKEDK